MRNNLELLIALKNHLNNFYTNTNGASDFICLCYAIDDMIGDNVLTYEEAMNLEYLLIRYKGGDVRGFWWPACKFKVRYDFVLECIEKEQFKPLI